MRPRPSSVPGTPVYQVITAVVSVTVTSSRFTGRTLSAARAGAPSRTGTREALATTALQRTTSRRLGRQQIMAVTVAPARRVGQTQRSQRTGITSGTVAEPSLYGSDRTPERVGHRVRAVFVEPMTSPGRAHAGGRPATSRISPSRISPSRP